MRSVLALLLIPAAATAGDPPFVAAARERQAKAKAFEVTLTVKMTWRRGQPTDLPAERTEHAAEGKATLIADGEKFWYRSDVPVLVSSGVRPFREEVSFDGLVTRQLNEVVVTSTGEKYAEGKITSGRTAWGHYFQPFRWLCRGADTGEPDTGWAELSSPGVLTPTDRTQSISGFPCRLYTRPVHRSAPNLLSEFWLDSELGHLPRRVKHRERVRTEIEYRSDPHIGPTPRSWKDTIVGGDLADEITREVAVESFTLHSSVRNERFRIAFPAGARVHDESGDRSTWSVVANDGRLVPVRSDTTNPENKPSSLAYLLLWLAGAAVFALVGLVLLVKRLARNRTDDSPDSGTSPPLLS